MGPFGLEAGSMDKRVRILVALIAMSAASSAFADCVYPKAPQQIPDGKTASEPEMIEAMTAFKQYNGDVNAYTSCLEKETAEKVRDAGSVTGVIMQIKSLQSKKHNAAIEELSGKAKHFNEQVRLFKTRAK
jgi:hypothetical protein